MVGGCNTSKGDKPVKCPHCGKPINAAAMLGSISTPAKAQAARENAKLGGWPKGKKRGKRKRIARRRNDQAEARGTAASANQKPL